MGSPNKKEHLPEAVQDDFLEEIMHMSLQGQNGQEYEFTISVLENGAETILKITHNDVAYTPQINGGDVFYINTLGEILDLTLVFQN